MTSRSRIYDLERARATSSRATDSNFHSRWNPAGDKVAFTSLLTGSFDLRTSAPDGRAAARVAPRDRTGRLEVGAGCQTVAQASSRPGRPSSGQDIQAMPSASRVRRRTLAGTPLDESDPQVSSDGQWLAWSEVDTLYVAHYPDMTHRVQVAVGASTARWAHQSHELFFEKDGQMHVVPWQAGPSGFTTGTATVLFAISRGPSRRRYLRLGRRHTLSHPRERYRQGITRGDPGNRRRLQRAGGAGRRRSRPS